MVCFAFACLLACEKGHFACFIFNPFFSLCPPFGKYQVWYISISLVGFSVMVSLVAVTRRVAMDTSFPGSTNLSRHQLPTSSVVDEF